MATLSTSLTKRMTETSKASSSSAPKSKTPSLFLSFNFKILNFSCLRFAFFFFFFWVDLSVLVFGFLLEFGFVWFEITPLKILFRSTCLSVIFLGFVCEGEQPFCFFLFNFYFLIF
jgi:hypothetical protein